jgi:uncharacterized membrane protein
VNRRRRPALKYFWEELLIKLFVDNVLLYKFFKCHRLTSRSFFIRNRQFHLCARCTGLLVGYIVSPLFLLLGEFAARAFIVFCTALILDGTTQILGWRQSNNTLRFATGLGTGATLLAFIWVLIRPVLKLG